MDSRPLTEALLVQLRDDLAKAALPVLVKRHEIAMAAELAAQGDRNPGETSYRWDEFDYWMKVSSGSYAVADAIIAARRRESHLASAALERLRDEAVIAALPALIERFELGKAGERKPVCEDCTEDVLSKWGDPGRWAGLAECSYVMAEVFLRARHGFPEQE